jgi:hypothetical protein
MSLLKKSRNRLLTRAAQNHCTDFAECYRAVTVRERSTAAFFSSLIHACISAISEARRFAADAPRITQVVSSFVRMSSSKLAPARK